jgi:outer membrane protein OmpA-like peptidoglycan-associated protein
MKNLIFSVLLILIFNSVGFALYPEEGANTQALFEEAKKAGCEEHAPELVREAQSLYEKAKSEFRGGNYKKARELEVLSQIRLKTAISVARKKGYEEEIRRLQDAITLANSEKQRHEEELEKNVSRLKEIKDRIAVSEERMRSTAFDALERAAEQIKIAEDTSAGFFAPGPLDKANRVYREAEGKLTLGEYEESKKLSEKAIALAEEAYQGSKKKSDLSKEIIEKVYQVYRVKAQPIEGGVRVVLEGVFAPSSTVIMFDSYPSLDSLAGILNGYTNLSLAVKAYPGNLVPEEGSRHLQIQAERVKNYLISKGISPERFKNAESSASSKLDKGDKQGGRHIEIIVNLQSE